MSSPEGTFKNSPDIRARLNKIEHALNNLDQLNLFLTDDVGYRPDFMPELSEKRLKHLKSHRKAIRARIEVGKAVLEQKSLLMRDLSKTSVFLDRVSELYSDRPESPVLLMAQQTYKTNLRLLLKRELEMPKQGADLPEVPPVPKFSPFRSQLGQYTDKGYVFPDKETVEGVESYVLGYVLHLPREQGMAVMQLCKHLFGAYSPENDRLLSKVIANLNQGVLTYHGFSILRLLANGSIRARDRYYSEPTVARS